MQHLRCLYVIILTKIINSDCVDRSYQLVEFGNECIHRDQSRARLWLNEV